MKRSHPERLSREEIAERAWSMVSETLEKEANRLSPAPLEQIISRFTKNGWLTFSTAEDLGTLPNNQKIYGEFRVEPFQILIDPCLTPWSPRFRFSLAHEIGHFVLHRKLIGTGKYIDRAQLPADSASKLKYREMAELSDLGWAEWQANEFALELLMPKCALSHDIQHIQKSLDIKNNLGIIYYDHQLCNRAAHGIIIGSLLHKYHIPKLFLTRRLRHLELIYFQQKNQTTSYSDE